MLLQIYSHGKRVTKKLQSKKKSDEANTLNRDSKVNSHSRVSLNCFFLSEEYKQYLTFSVEISTNTLITQYSKHLWSDEQ